MKIKSNNNILLLSAVAIFLGFSQIASAAYTCDTFVGPGTNRIVTGCWNNGPLPSSPEAPINYSAPMGYTYGGGAPLFPASNSTNTTNTTNTSTTNRATTNNTAATTKTTTANKNTTTKNTVVKDAQTSADTQAPIYNDTNNGLTALSLSGSNSFMPDTFWEWLCVFFLLLVIIILIRQFRPKTVHEVHTPAHH